MVKNKLGFLCSGRGSNLDSILKACSVGVIKATPTVVISDQKKAKALSVGQQHGLHSYYVDHTDLQKADQNIKTILAKHEITFVILAGYLKKVGPITLETFSNKMVNIHPSLLPKYGGHNMYGLNVHKAVLAAGDRESGATVHMVSEQYDQGRILAQQKVPVYANDTDIILAQRVLTIEHKIYPMVIRDILEGKTKLHTG